VLKKRNHRKKPGNATACCEDEWKAGVWGTAPSSLAERDTLLWANMFFNTLLYGLVL
jgi:hypothetical protein